jgi:hypothetical protein
MATAVQLNTMDLPEAEMRAKRSKSQHWAMRSGPRRFVCQRQNEWCTRSELVSIPEKEMEVTSTTDAEQQPPVCRRPTLEFGEILAAAGSSCGPPLQKRSHRQQHVLSASWIVPATASGKNKAKNSTVIQEHTENHEDEGEWPTLRRPGAAAGPSSTAPTFFPPRLSDTKQKDEEDFEVGSESCCASESWEVCSNASSMASSWAVLEGEQRLKDDEENKSSWADILGEAGLRLKENEEEQVVADVGTATEVAAVPAVRFSFAEAVRRGGSGRTTIGEDGCKDTTNTKTEDDAAKKASAFAPAPAPAVATEGMARAEDKEAVSEADMEFYHDTDDDWDGFVCSTHGALEKDNRGGGGRTKAAKGPRSVVQQERVAASRVRRTAQRAKDRGMAKDRGIAKAM